MASSIPPPPTPNLKKPAAPSVYSVWEPTADEVAALDRQLTRLIANYEASEATYIALSRRPLPPYMTAARQARGLTDDQWAELEAAYEADSGLLAASDASDAAYDRMISFTKQLLALPSFSRSALRLKARACLFEAPLERLREEGFSGLAVFMAQLVAPDHDGAITAPPPR